MSTISETIRGINVVIGSETTALTASLGDVNRASRDIQNELKQVERLLRLDPTNTELVAQQQELLGQAIANSTTRLNALRNAQEQVDRQFANGEINEGQYRAFQREVASAEQQLRRMETRLEATGEAGRDLGETMRNTGDKLKNAGEAMSKFVSVPIAGFVALATEGTKELRKELAILETNATMAGVSIDEVNKLYVEMQGITDDLGANTEGLSNIMSTGFKGDQMRQAMENIQGAAIKFKETLKFEGIADGLQETLATGAAVGPFGELLERSGVSLDTFNAGLTAAIANGTQLQYALDTMTNLGLAGVYETYKKTNPEMIAAAEAQMKLQMAMAELGNTIQPYITAIVEKITELVGWFKELSPAGQNAVLVIGAIGLAIGPVLVIIGSLISAIGTISTALAAEGALAVAVRSASTFIRTGLGSALTFLVGPGAPIALVVLALAGIGLIVYEIIKHWEPIKQFFSEALKGIALIFTDAKESIFGVWSDLKSGIVGMWGAVKGALEPIISSMVGKWEGFKNGVLGVWNGIVGGIKSAVNVIIGAINMLIRGMNKINFSVPDWVPKIGGQSWGINISEIPKLHGGGTYKAPPGYTEGLALLKDGERVTPAGASSPAEVQQVQHSGTITVKGVTDKGQIMGVVDIIMQQLQAEARA